VSLLRALTCAMVVEGGVEGQDLLNWGKRTSHP
jgi:hypothetical protein